MRPQAKALGLCLLGAFLWFLPWLVPGKALLGVHPALFRPFEQAVTPALLAEAKAASHPLYSDKLLQHDPEVRFSAQGIAERGFPPAWNPEVLGGIPHLATGLSSALYPLLWISAVIPPPRCYAVIALLQTALCGWFAYLMLRAFELRAPAAACGALLFAASGWMSVHQEYFQLTAAATWLPLALFGAKRLLDDGVHDGHGAAGPIALGLAVACAFLSGFPQIAVFVLLAPGLLFAGTAIGRLRRSQPVVRPAIELALAVLLGLAIASPQLLATAELVPRSTRQPLSAAVIEPLALPPAALAGALLPELVAPSRSQAASETRGVQESLFELALAGKGQRNNRFEVSFPLGPAALLLALFAAASPRRGARWFFLALLGVGLALVLPGPLLRASTHVPGLDIGDPKRALLLVEVALVGLAALGIEPLLEDARARRRAFVLFAASVLLLGGVAWWTSASASAGDLLREWAAPRIASNLSLEVAVVNQALTTERVDASRGLLTMELLRAAGFVALALAALAWRHLQPERRAPIGGLLVALALPLWLFWRETTAPIPTAGLDAKPALVQYFESHPPRGRIVRVGSRGEMPPWPPKLPMNAGVRDAQGYVAVYLGAWRELLEAADPGCTETVGVRPLTPSVLTLPLFDLLDVEYAIASLPKETGAASAGRWQLEPLEEAAPAGGDPAEADPKIVLWRNPAAVGRAFFVTKIELYDDSRDLVAALASPEFRPREQALLLSSVATPLRRDRRWSEPKVEKGERASLVWIGGGTDAHETATVELVSEASDALAFKVTGGSGGLLIQTDCWYPGWSVRVDGANAELLPVDHALRGVVVSPGEHAVEFRYLPGQLTLGLFLAPAALAALVFLGVRRSRPPGP